MKQTLRGRPRLNLDMRRIVMAVRQHRQIMGAARQLGCSDSYVHVRFKEARLSLRQVLEADSVESLLHSQRPACARPRSRTLK